MSDLETKTSDPVVEPENLGAQCAALQRQVFTLLIALFVVSGTLTVFLWRQARYAQKDIEAVKAPAAQLIQAFNQEKPGMDKFVGQLVEYGRAHPDFVPILNKYRIPLTTTSAPVAPAVTPAATPAAAPK
jgi:hypothetical protein